MTIIAQKIAIPCRRDQGNGLKAPSASVLHSVHINPNSNASIGIFSIWATFSIFLELLELKNSGPHSIPVLSSVLVGIKMNNKFRPFKLQSRFVNIAVDHVYLGNLQLYIFPPAEKKCANCQGFSSSHSPFPQFWFSFISLSALTLWKNWFKSLNKIQKCGS